MNTLLDAMKERGPAENRAETGYIENWGASLGQTIDEDLSVSEYLNSGAFRERNSELLDMIRAGDIPNSAIYHRDHKDFNGGINYDEAAKYANSMLDKKYQTDDEINKNIRESLQERRTHAETVHNDANVMGKIGQFAGALHGFAIDPINAGTMFLGAGQLSRGVLNLAKREAIIAGTSEAAIQPFVHSWKQDIGADYSAGDAVANIVMATGMGGTIGALTAGIGKLLRKKPVTKEEKTAYEAAEYLQNELKEAPPEMGGAEFLGNIDNTARQINDAKPEFIPQAGGVEKEVAPQKTDIEPGITNDEIISILDEVSPGTGVIRQSISEAEKVGKGFIDENQKKLVGTNPEWYTKKGLTYKAVQSLTDKLKKGVTKFNKSEQNILDAVDDYTGKATEQKKIEAQAAIDEKIGSPVATKSTEEQKSGFDAFMDDEVDLRFDTLSKENPDMPTILSHEKDLQGETVINYGRATDEVKKIEAQELELESIKGCLLGG